MDLMDDAWVAGNPYERFMGRWSRLVAAEFLGWLNAPPHSHWLDVGCGTGALSQIILATQQPVMITGIDSSAAFVAHGQQVFPAGQAQFKLGQAESIPAENNQFEATVSGLVLNFVPEPASAVAEMIRVTRPGGQVGFYVWDYAGRMQMLRYFWDAAVALDPGARALDEGERFPLCRPEALAALMAGSGLIGLDVAPLEVVTPFTDFADFWEPFLGQVGPAPAYVGSLPAATRDKLVERLQATLPRAADGSIPLVARAWAVRGTVPEQVGETT
jgi:SAM-dependent methyltransferase